MSRLCCVREIEHGLLTVRECAKSNQTYLIISKKKNIGHKKRHTRPVLLSRHKIQMHTHQILEGQNCFGGKESRHLKGKVAIAVYVCEELAAVDVLHDKVYCLPVLKKSANIKKMSDKQSASKGEAREGLEIHV